MRYGPAHAVESVGSGLRVIGNGEWMRQRFAIRSR
jgi:hypothetical protein